MNYFVKAVCPRCGLELTGNPYDPCPRCRKDYNINYETVFDVKDAKFPAPAPEKGIYRFRDFFALKDSTKGVTLGEGNTPLRKLENLGNYFGLHNVYMKDESKNPLMSHKDRLCSLLITKAVELGAPGIVISSTGNQGASAAAYCQAAGIPCVVFTTPNVSPMMKLLMQSMGAYVFVTPTAEDRLVVMRQVVEKLGYFPASGMYTPPIGSLCYAVDAYKTIAFETYEQMGNELPDWFVVPVSYGDTLYGIYKGVRDLKDMGLTSKCTHMCAAEPFGATRLSVESGQELPISVNTHPSIQTSIASGYTTYLTMNAIRDSKGTSEISTDAEVIKMQELLARKESVFAEPSSVSAVVALQKLVEEHKIDPDEKIVLVITSTGLKDPETAMKWQPKIPNIQPDFEEFLKAMKESYGYTVK